MTVPADSSIVRWSSPPVMCKPKPPRQSAYPSGASRCRDQGKTHGVTIPGMKKPVLRVTASCGQQTPMRNPEATSRYINAARPGTPSMSHDEGSGRIWVRPTMLPEVPSPIRARRLSQIHGGGQNLLSPRSALYWCPHQIPARHGGVQGAAQPL
jgi:hypothetical protein